MLSLRTASSPLSINSPLPQSNPILHSLPVQSVRFAGQEHSTDETKSLSRRTISYLFRPLVKLMVYTCTHPHFGLAWIPNRFLHFFPHREWKKILPNLQDIHFKSGDGTPLKGYWLPAKKGEKYPYKTVALGHGYFTHAGSMLSLAQTMHEKGYNVFMFDFRAHGKSGGCQTSIGFHEAKDWMGVTKYLKENQAQASQDITLLGHSMGASSLLLMPHSLSKEQVAYMAKNVQRLILDAPYAHLDLNKNPFVTRTYEAPWLNPKNSFLNILFKPMRALIRGIGEDFATAMNHYARQELKMPESFDDIAPAERFKDSILAQKPILLMHGTKDGRTPFKQAEEIAKCIRENPTHHLTFRHLEGVDHINNDWVPLSNKPKQKYKAVLRDDAAFKENKAKQKDIYSNQIDHFINANP